MFQRLDSGLDATSRSASPRQPAGRGDEARSAVFLAERRLPGLTATDLQAVERALIEASRRVSLEGAPVRYLHSTYVAGDQRWLGMFVGASPDAVNRVFGIAQVPDGSVIEVADCADVPGETDVAPPTAER